MAELSPMMRQYMQIKENNKDSILFFRLGDFYEMFFEDAKTASKELDLVLTGKDCGQEERAPMCGIPYHSCESYIARLIEKGYKVAICEQVENPATAKGLVKRDVVRVITPGTVIEDSMLDEAKNNYLAALSFEQNSCGICFVDVSTGHINITEIFGKDFKEKVYNELNRVVPSEVITCENWEEIEKLKSFCDKNLNACLSCLPQDVFQKDVASNVIKNHFSIKTLSEKGLQEGSAASTALSAALQYLKITQMTGIDRIQNINIYDDSQFMHLDITAMKNLELCETIRGKEKKGSLLWAIDKTKTAMGKRQIRKWIEQPLMNPINITLRHNSVEELMTNTIVRGEIREQLSEIHDIDRLMTKIVFGTAGGRELKSLSYTISKFTKIKEYLKEVKSRMLQEIRNDIDLLEDVYELIEKAIVDEPPFSIREGGIIRQGYNEQVDTLRSNMSDTKGFIAKVEADEKQRTGIKNLKIRYNKVFGYYIEITNSYNDKVPDNYIRKQTLTNCERYITDELKKLEETILGARERSVELEFQIFDDIRKHTAAQLARIQKTADAISRLDVLASFAEVAVKNNYCRPTINQDGIIRITAGRHPVVEEVLPAPFVPNDTLLDLSENRCAIITGPNMAGKSTYMRQVALITILAQAGSYVPAQAADLCVVDAVYTRVGASDDLSTGKSTFMVEMSEVAQIIKNATNQSLLILDEIGRGTSTYDGMSIARAVLEHVVDNKKIGAKTLFATHYHELTSLEGEIKGVKNYNVSVKKRGDDVTFLRRIVRGGADDSYGIEVAKLSGIPNHIINRAKEILKQLENEKPIVAKIKQKVLSEQITIESDAIKQLFDELKNIDVNTLSPIEALTLLYDFVNKAEKIDQGDKII